MIRLVRPFILGVREWRSCAHGGVGMTYDDACSPRSNAYDRGVNLGENVAHLGGLLAAAGRVVRHPLTQHVDS